MIRTCWGGSRAVLRPKIRTRNTTPRGREHAGDDDGAGDQQRVARRDAARRPRNRPWRRRRPEWRRLPMHGGPPGRVPGPRLRHAPRGRRDHRHRDRDGLVRPASGPGYDHLVFLFALLLVCGSLGEAARVVTGFTVGHSATLALAALGWVTPARGAVEAVVGLSIALVALENVWLAGGDHRLPVVAVAGLLAAAALAGVAGRVPPQTLVGLALFAACYFALLARSARPAGLRWPVAALFGLVHGLGFAGMLAEMTLPRARLVPALLGFNVGVELGQLAAVAAAWPVLDLLARRGEPWRAAVVGYGSAGVLAMGVLWFAGRAFG